MKMFIIHKAEDVFLYSRSYLLDSTSKIFTGWCIFPFAQVLANGDARTHAQSSVL